MKPEITTPKSEIVIGCQGWNYTDWTTRDPLSPIFYPKGTRSGEMLPIYASAFAATEIDSTFYAVPPVSNIEKWDRETPSGFLFSPKLPQEVTHERRLGEDSYPIVEVFCDRLREFGEKLAVCLVQLPPQFEPSRPNAIRLRSFLEFLPRDLRFAVEFRHSGWFVDWTYEELGKHAITPAIVEGKWIPNRIMFDAASRVRGEFAYVRFMGERDLTSFDRIWRDRTEHLRVWSNVIAEIETDRTFVFFSNLYEGHAPESCRKLAASLGLESVDPSVFEKQKSLF